MNKPNVTIACVPREVFSMTQQSLETLYQRTSEPFELVYVDGGSPSEVRSYLEHAARAYGFTLIRTDCYLSPNQARNIALDYVATPYVAFVDNDALVSKGWLRALVDCAEQTDAWAVGPLYFEFLPERHRVHMAGGVCRLEEEADGSRYCSEQHHQAHVLFEEIKGPLQRKETELIEFHTVLIAMEAFNRIGPLDEGLMAMSEHADICLSIRHLGERVFLEPKSQVTYAPPSRLSAADRNFFELRWSEAWCKASLERFVGKWNLAPHHSTVQGAHQWFRHHRLYGSRIIRRLRSLLGRRVTSWAEEHLLGRCETYWNRFHYPARKHGTLQQPDIRVVYAPSNASRRAA